MSEVEESTETTNSYCKERYRWVQYSESKLAAIEKQILKVLKTAYNSWHVHFDHTNGSKEKIWTISMNTESKNTPLVLLHGFGAGIGFWCLNLDSFAANRPVYAIDLLGFGRSSRPDFSSNDGLENEQHMVHSIEQWRKEMNLDSFILLGHSLGGYLATSYSIKYPERVKHLILADPWGFAEKPENFNPPLKIKIFKIVFYPLTFFNPLAFLRAAGPLGPWGVKKIRSDIAIKYEGKLEDHNIISDYIYHCNAQKPSGEVAFSSMTQSAAWAKHPMINRTHLLDKKIPITVLFGENSWIEKSIGQKLQEQRPNSYVKINIVEESGHHLHADNVESFNELVVQACNYTENFEEKENHKETCDNNYDIEVEKLLDKQLCLD